MDAVLNLSLYAMHCWSHVKLRAGDVGLRDRDFPQDYAGQFVWPFRRAQSVSQAQRSPAAQPCD
ncbi:MULTISPECIES: hypothetical protein [Gammaproteobacteria]|uniref:Uncharacterized protein n=1 Tax=Immundisolibacter cernigliae TaxID=1810504 RepID=A0A1B1YT79_9GAMM|nr:MULTISPECIES: hypothetical protein [Gammaproteobacteria]ANX03922.1 hypothetical protein PG2T_06760 [Immundisolibacter cernigliae]EIZ0539890.1 hypothetical protein [Pseudomonas aeruginosa]EKW1417703.1 hypothetical protein [Pseudomonas aeruginosa]EKW1532589.1 hypothetical protein [Pseudomonas aeruginosa]MEA3220054.1 hypothetical protein [Immundisolibacter sp.]